MKYIDKSGGRGEESSMHGTTTGPRENPERLLGFRRLLKIRTHPKDGGRGANG